MQTKELIYIVTGLPRSGTSLMMQMLAAGGLPVLTDSKRPANISNSKGYWEWEAVKKLETNPYVLSDAQGMAVKIISPLLAYLPETYTYKIIFMRRKTEHIIRSQNRMLQKEGKPLSSLSDERLVQLFNHQVMTSKQELQKKEIPFYEVWYEHIVQNPKPVIKGIAAFLEQPLDLSAMLKSIDVSLNHFK